MAGEQLQQAAVGVHVVEGDRVVHVRSGQGQLATARTYPNLLGHPARLDEQGTPLVDGRSWSQPSVLADVRKIVGPSAELIRDGSQDWFDILPLLGVRCLHDANVCQHDGPSPFCS